MTDEELDRDSRRGEYQGFDVTVAEPGIAVVTLNRPERLNAMSGGPGGTWSSCCGSLSSTTMSGSWC